MSSPDSPQPDPERRVNRWLVWILAASLACGLSIVSAYLLIGNKPKSAFERTGWSVLPTFFSRDYRDDSMGPMGRAFLRFKAREDGDIYGIFFDEGRKFQYPPTSLLLFYVVPDSFLSPENFKMQEVYTKLSGRPKAIMRTASQLAVLATIAATIAILEIGLRRLRMVREDETMASRVVRISIVAFLGFTFYPVMKAHQLGQIQVYLNALTALGVLAHLLGWQARSGFLLGLCCLVKPQFGVLLIWAVIRRHWRLLGGFLLGVVPLGLTSLAVFGWTNHMRYLDVIRQLARVGESYWPNQSFNGFMHRLLGNGDPSGFSGQEFAPYHPWVHAVTVVTSLVILGLALFQRRAVANENPTLDLAVVIAASTMASPIAWEHHYGAFLPLFALALPGCLQNRKLGLMLGAAFLAMSVELLAADSYFTSWWRGMAASHLFFGAVLFFALLLYLRQHPENPRGLEPACSD